MARRATATQLAQVSRLLAQHTPLIRAAVLESVRLAHGAIDMNALVAAIESGDANRVAAFLSLDQGALFPLQEAVRAATVAGGMSVVAPRGLTGGFSFTGSHPYAERMLRENGARLVSQIGSPGVEVLQDILFAGQTQGLGAQRIARQLAGVVNPATGIREGGVLGLDGPRASRALSVRSILADPARLGEYFKADGTPRYVSTDRRWDPMIRRAIANGEGIPAAEAEKLARLHEARLLKARATTIAQNEAFTAQAIGRNIAYGQILERDDVETVEKRWQHASLNNPRPDHQRMDGETVGFNDTFPAMDDGAELQFPHDPTGGPEHSISCRCTVIYIPTFKKDEPALDIASELVQEPVTSPVDLSALTGVVTDLPTSMPVSEWAQGFVNELDGRDAIFLTPEHRSRLGQVLGSFRNQDEFTDVFGGRTERYRQTVVKLVRDGLSVEFSDGRNVREMTRIIELGSTTIRHEYFKVRVDVRGRGIAKQILADSVRGYEEMGITRITTRANIDVGGYAWARYGFTPDDLAWRNLQNDHLKTFNLQNLGMNADEAAAMRVLINSDDPRAIWAIADSEWGKDLLAGSDWAGSLNLADPVTMERLNAYLQK